LDADGGIVAVDQSSPVWGKEKSWRSSEMSKMSVDVQIGLLFVRDQLNDRRKAKKRWNVGCAFGGLIQEVGEFESKLPLVGH